MKAFLLAAVLLITPGLAAAEDLSGEWDITSTAGNTPIHIHCTLLQTGQVLSGSCAPRAESRGPLFTGTVQGNHASWGYDVTYQGQPSRVAFDAELPTDRTMTGTLTLSGKPSAFTATME